MIAHPLLLALALLPAPRAPLCSVHIVPGRDYEDTYFLATSTGESRVAGAGPMRERARNAAPKFDPRTVRGQVMRLERVGGGYAPDVEEAFGRLGAREAVVVSWGMDAECDPHPVDPARWPPRGTRGVMVGRLRPMPRWVEGRPTFDVFPAEMYPDPRRPPPPVPCGGPLSADEYFAFLRVLPPRHVRQSSHQRLFHERMARWFRAHPEMLARRPVPDFVNDPDIRDDAPRDVLDEAPRALARMCAGR